MSRVAIHIFCPEVIANDLLVGRMESETHRMRIYHILHEKSKIFRSKTKKKN